MKKYIILLLIFISVLYVDLIKEGVLLTDDLARVLEKDKSNNYIEFLKLFLNTDTMSSRPVSGFFYSFSIYFIKSIGLNVYYLNYLYYLTSLLLVYNVSLYLIKDGKLSFITMVIYACFPFASSTIFSPIMMNSNLATIFYCLSLLCLIHKDSEKYGGGK